MRIIILTYLPFILGSGFNLLSSDSKDELSINSDISFDSNVENKSSLAINSDLEWKPVVASKKKETWRRASESRQKLEVELDKLMLGKKFFQVFV